MLPLLDNVGEEEVTETPVPEQEEVSDTVNLQQLIAALDGIDDAPKEYELEEWKELYGQFHVSTILGDDNLYIWRTIKRQEYKQLINSGIAKNQIMYEEAVIIRCALWPKYTKEKISKTEAGVIETLAKQILFQSGFVPDQMALNMIKTV